MDFFFNAEEAILKENSGELCSFGERQKSFESKTNRFQAARLKTKSNHVSQIGNIKPKETEILTAKCNVTEKKKKFMIPVLGTQTSLRHKINSRKLFKESKKIVIIKIAPTDTEKDMKQS